jgi:hypothetical protein
MISMDEENLPKGIFFRSSVNIEVNQGNNNIFTYSKTLPRYGHQNKAGAISKNHLEIERDIEENFIKEFRKTTGI